MAGTRAEQSVARFRESERLAEAGDAPRAVEILHLAAELAIDELAERNDVAARRENLSPHEARARAAVELRGQGLVPAGFDNLLRRLNEDRKRTKYDGKPTRFDRMTLAQAQASVKLVIDVLDPDALRGPAAPAPAPHVVLPEGVDAPPPPPPPGPAPPHRRRWVLGAAGAAVLAAGVLAAVLVSGGDDEAADEPAARVVAEGAPGRLGPVSVRVSHAYTGERIDVGEGIRARGIFLVAGLRLANGSDVLQPQQVSAFRVQTRDGATVPVYGRASGGTIALQPGKTTSVQLPFDVAADRLAGARLLVDRVSRGGKRLGPGLSMAVPLQGGVGAIKAGTWRGATSQGLRFTMRIDRGEVIRRLSVQIRAKSGRVCPVRFSGVYFIDGTRFSLDGDAVAAGRFSTSTQADGAVVTPAGGRCSADNVRWNATTPLR